MPARWNSLGTYVFVETSVPALLADAERLARAVLAEVDRTCSRFREDSDLVRSNARPGRWTEVDPLLAAAVQVAVEAAEATDGLVDPCLGRPLVWLGYDADLAVVRGRPAVHSPAPAPEVRPGRWREIGVDPEGAVRVPPGCALDLGATAKAWASDLVAATVADELGCGVVVSLGGDVRVAGPPPEHQAWPVSVTERPVGVAGEAASTPWDHASRPAGREVPEAPEVVWLGSGGLATSSTTARRWVCDGQERHHLLDPRTGRPAEGPWRTVTAAGATCVAANTATTAALVLGTDAVPWLERHRVTTRLVSQDGVVTRLGSWPAPPASAPSPRLAPDRSS